jgi:hypothetical protein
MKTPENKIYLNYNEFNEVLKQLFNLVIDEDTICKYMDTYGQNQSQYNYKNPLVFTCTFKDETGKGWANIYGRFYKEHTTKKTDLFKEKVGRIYTDDFIKSIQQRKQTFLKSLKSLLIHIAPQ